MHRILVLGVVVAAMMAVALPAQASTQFRTELTGANEVGEGDPDGHGFAQVTMSQDGSVCFTIATVNVDDIVAAHIHEGAAGVNGGVVVDLDLATNGLAGCVSADLGVLAAIRSNPAGYYVNVHSLEFLPGAVRGQLG